MALAQKCSHVVLLSGTPATSRPFELYAQIKAVLPGANLTQKEFSDQYCAGELGGWNCTYLLCHEFLCLVRLFYSYTCKLVMSP